MPTIPLETAVPAPAAPVPAAPKRTARRSAPKQDRAEVKQVVYESTSQSSLAHAPDHSWLIGRLEQDEAKEHWFIRYADPGENERLGGRLELLRSGPMDGFRVGQLVRAEGELVDPAPLQTQPAYHPRSLQALPR